MVGSFQESIHSLVNVIQELPLIKQGLVHLMEWSGAELGTNFGNSSTKSVSSLLSRDVRRRNEDGGEEKTLGIGH